MPNRPKGAVAVKKRLESKLPLEEIDLTLTFTDTGKFFITNKDKTLKEIASTYTGFLDFTDLQLRGLKEMDKLYLTKENKIYGFDGIDYIEVSGNNSLIKNEF